MAWMFVVVAALTFGALTWIAWTGSIAGGLTSALVSAGLLAVSAVTWFLGRRQLAGKVRKRADLVAKVVFTVGGMIALLRHPIEVDGVGRVPLHEAIATYVGQVDGQTFIFWALVAMAVKFVGVLSSAFSWHLLLAGQGLRFPYWRFTITSFLIGRFIGTFLPSTLGLDGYTLYEAVRYSGQGARAVTAKALEKFIGITGLFLGMVLTMPFGYSVIREVTAGVGRPEAAPLLAAAIALVAGGISAVVVVGLVWPVVLVGVLERLTGLTERLGGGGPLVGKAVGVLRRFTEAAGAYEGKVGLLMLALLMKFVTHFTTFVVYYFTGLAIGVLTMEFWPVVFGSSIQVLATILSPTIAGEGAREAFQALLLTSQYGGTAQAVLAAALGFITAEAATLWGGVFLFTRKPAWRPAFVQVDGQQVDFAWIAEDDDARFNPERTIA